MKSFQRLLPHHKFSRLRTTSLLDSRRFFSSFTTPATSDGVPLVYQNHHVDSTLWQKFQHRQDDIFIATAMKCGTTWMQNIVGNLLFLGKKPPQSSFFELSPWLDSRLFNHEDILNALEAQTHRRYLKTHTPLDSIVFYPSSKYIYVGRDLRDVTMSLWNHYKNFSDGFYELQQNVLKEEVARLPRPPDDIHDYIKPFFTRGWMPGENDGYPFWSNIHHLTSWFDCKHLDNIYFVHYNDLLDDLGGEMKKIATFLDIPIESNEIFEEAVRACTFESMKKNARELVAPTERAFKKGADTFIYKGTNRRWEGVFTEEELDLYEQMMSNLPEYLKRWSENGGPIE